MRSAFSLNQNDLWLNLGEQRPYKYDVMKPLKVESSRTRTTAPQALLTTNKDTLCPAVR